VTEGSGSILVTAVGTKSEWGKTLELVGEAGDEDTPLQVCAHVCVHVWMHIASGLWVLCARGVWSCHASVRLYVSMAADLPWCLLCSVELPSFGAVPSLPHTNHILLIVPPLTSHSTPAHAHALSSSPLPPHNCTFWHTLAHTVLNSHPHCSRASPLSVEAGGAGRCYWQDWFWGRHLLLCCPAHSVSDNCACVL
jgi:hypothetical protein